MITKEDIRAQAGIYQSETGWDDNSRMSFTTGAFWANDMNKREIAAKDAEIAELVEALFYLRNNIGQTEENVSGVHRKQWDRATAVLKKYGK